MTTLRGLLVDLVPFTSESDDKMYTYWNNESRVWATMGDQEQSRAKRLKRIQEHALRAASAATRGWHFMMRARDGNIIGHDGLNWIDYWNRQAEIGAWIGEEDYWGGGHGTDGLLLLASTRLTVRRAPPDARTMAINERAQRNVEKVGFVLEARKRLLTLVNGAWIDGLEYGMMRDEWRGREALVDELGLREKAEKRYGKVD